MDVDAGHGAALGRALPDTARRAAAGPPAARRCSAGRAPTTDPVDHADPHPPRASTPTPTPACCAAAYAVAEHMHRGQIRKSGEPYITHPLAVAQILAELGMDTTTLVAALLHDTVEDTSYTLQRAATSDFGGEVALPGRRRDQVRQGVLRRGAPRPRRSAR